LQVSVVPSNEHISLSPPTLLLGIYIVFTAELPADPLEVPPELELDCIIEPSGATTAITMDDDDIGVSSSITL